MEEFGEEPMSLRHWHSEHREYSLEGQWYLHWLWMAKLVFGKCFKCYMTN
ncbi:hypothetical protein Goshw_006860 [Gossypium schwendimanii]|uniref:Uncharacterized protein n=1 Tax=Gossypium schwendimanii TaxID=34291 RepID=A0A7J9LEB6_GOSSC|nr:hypothetical protein [Gossypium schwendimanii]